MDDLKSFLEALEARGAEFWFEGSQLRFRAPQGTLSADARSKLARHRDDVLTLLRERADARVTQEPMSYGQRSLWLVHQENPASAAYNVAFVVEVRSPMVEPVLREALQMLLDRHPALRTTYAMADGRPVQRVHGRAPAALEMFSRPGLDDEFTEHVFLFAPLHDIGKIGIPDSILQKPGRLTLEERHIMQRHVEIGVEAFDRIIADMSLSEDRAVTIMRNIIAYHHETLDGQGYPYGIGGNDLPLEARIVAVADVFDALTSERPYKRKWTNEEAFAELLAMVERGKLDAECVTSFIDNLPLIEETQLRFTEHEVLSP